MLTSVSELIDRIDRSNWLIELNDWIDSLNWLIELKKKIILHTSLNILQMIQKNSTIESLLSAKNKKNANEKVYKNI